MSVIVCVYTERRWPQILRAVGSVLDQRVPADEVIVVVDHNPALLDRARAAMPAGLRVVASTGPRGLSGARNTGVAHARGDVVAFLDDDAEAEPDWLARLLRHYRDPAVLAVGGRAEPAWPGGRPRWLPPEFDWVVGCSFAGQPSRLAPVRNVIGCTMSFRRDILDHVHGFDPALGRIGRIPVGCEETELCIRIRRARPGGVVLYEPAARVRHQVSADRATWRYFRRRCLSEGRSKAVVARMVGSGAGLSAEREYTRRVLPRGVRRELREVRDGDGGGLLRLAVIGAGLLFTATGFAAAQARRASSATAAPARAARAARATRATRATRPAAPAGAAAGRRRRGRGPAPVRVLAVELGEGVAGVPDADGPGTARCAAAQVLVRLHGHPLGVLDIGLPTGGLTAQALVQLIRQRLDGAIDAHLRADGLAPLGRGSARITGLGTSCPSRRGSAGADPFVSVIVPTCGRMALLGRLLDSLAQVDYPRLEIIVVDNAPHLAGTAHLVARRAARDGRLRYTSEARAGVTHARNRGLAEARGEIVAFADDDVVVDRRWVRALVNGFTDDAVAGVTGHVLAGELDTPAQVWVERYGGFAKGCQRRRFDRHGIQTVRNGAIHGEPVETRTLYPYLPGGYGTGANMAFRAEVARVLGGFDPLLGSGSAVGAGEDIDLLLRLILAGHALVYEPSAIVWHTHRRELTALRRVVYRYGTGLTAVMAKSLATDPAGRRELLRRVPGGIAYALAPHSPKNSRKRAGYPASLTALELSGMALGPVLYATAACSARARRSWASMMSRRCGR